MAGLVRRGERAALAFIGVGFLFAGALLGARANHTALNTPVSALFDRNQHQLFATVEGRLRADASLGPVPPALSEHQRAEGPALSERRESRGATLSERRESRGATLSVAIDRIELDGVSHSTSGGAIVGVGGELGSNHLSQWRAGRRVRFPATLRQPATFLNPGVPDAQRQFAWRGATLVGSVKSDRLVEVVAPGSVVSEATAAVRAAVRGALLSNVAPWSHRSAAVVSAILIGDRAGLGDDVERRLQEAGTYHVIAISGGNIAILAAIFVVCLRVLRVSPRWSALIIILLLSVYARIVEGGSSVGRATLMAAIYFAAQIVDHRTRPGNVAAVSAIVLFCLNPLQIVDAGFALTFGATLGILIGVPRLVNISTTPRFMQPALALLAATICAEVALLPISAFVFSRVTAAGLAMNFAAIPLMTVVQVFGMVAVALDQLGIDGALWAGRIAHWAVEGLIGSAALVDITPWITRRVPPPSIAVIAIYYGALLVAIATRPKSKTFRIATLIVAVCSVWIVLAPVIAIRSTRDLLRVTFLDVGQGDAAIVQFPDGRALSVDAGGVAGSSFDLGGRIVSPALWAVGVRRLDYMSITHGDTDHIGGAASVFRDFAPLEVWEGVPVPPHRPTNELRQLAKRAATAWRTLQPDDHVRFGDVDLFVRHPPRPDWERQRIRNDDSEVLEIRYGGVSFVFTGDIGREVERSIALSFERAPIRILKVPHHGSATSSSREFLDALGPDIAVISCGRGNPFGHPVPSVLDRYRSIGAAIYRTDQDGAVTIETDGETVRVRTFTNRHLTVRTRGR